MSKLSGTKNPFNIIVIVAALGYFVDIYDLILFSIVRVPSLKEIGIPADRVEILVQLPPFETRSSSFRIHPFVGRIIQPIAWRRNEREVAEIMDVSLVELIGAEVLDEGVAASAMTPAPQRTPYYRVGDYQLWGLSYRILRALVPRLRAGEWEI